MKFSMQCNVVSNTLLPGEVPVLFNGRTYVFYRNERGLLSKIKIIADVEDPTKFYSVLTKSSHIGPNLTIETNYDTELYDSLHKEFQELESLIAFKYDLQGIDWGHPRYELICETDEERDKAGLLAFEETRPRIGSPQIADAAGLSALVQLKECLNPLIAPLSFYREAINDLRALKYINVFFNCYFIIEGLFGNGKTKNNHVERELKNSADFVSFVKDLLQTMPVQKPAYHAKIRDVIRKKGKALDTDSVIELLVSTRGDLHHFQNNPSRPQGTPFRHKEYEAIAFLARGVAINALFFRMIEIYNSMVKSGKAVDNSLLLVFRSMLEVN